MPHRRTSTLLNPMIGIYFGIFTACLAAIVVLLLIFEQLGVASRSLNTTLALGGMALFAAVGAGGYTTRMREFVNAGQRVPAFYGGLTMAIAAIGGAGLTGFAGALFLSGFDMLFLGLGLLAGLAAMLMLIAPFLRKFGMPTVPGYLANRFESGAVRLVAASIAVVPLVLMLVAEFKIALLATTWLTPMSPALATGVLAAVLIATIAPGGVRSFSWSGATQALAVCIALLLPTAIAAIMETNLPFGQLSHGPILRAVMRAEASLSVPVPVASPMALDLPGMGLQPLATAYATTFGKVGPVAFVLCMLSIMAGVAGSPALLPRAITAPTVYDTRKSIGWAVMLVGIAITTFSTIAVLERYILSEAMLGQASASVTSGIRSLIQLGHATIASGQSRLTPASLLIERDATLVSLPILLGMPGVLVSLVATGILAAALAGAGASLTQLAIIVGEDVVHAPKSWLTSDAHRLLACRIAIVLLAGACATTALLIEGDPFVLLLNALAFSGSTLFPVLVLSVWWKRVTGLGALAGLVTGFVIVVVIVVATQLAGLSIPALMAPAAAGPLALVAAVGVSLLTPAPGRDILEKIRDLRVPGGETVYDRELRQARQRGARST